MTELYLVALITTDQETAEKGSCSLIQEKIKRFKMLVKYIIIVQYFSSILFSVTGLIVVAL